MSSVIISVLLTSTGGVYKKEMLTHVECHHLSFVNSNWGCVVKNSKTRGF